MKRFTSLVLLLLLLFAGLFAQNTAGNLESSLIIPASGLYSTDILIIPVALYSGIFLEYQFAGSDSWISLDTVLCLAAMAGEQRTYTLSFRQKNRSSSAQIQRSYVIDKKKPPEPVIMPPGNDIFGELKLEIASENTVFYSISPDIEFHKYDPENPGVFKAFPDVAQEIVVSAYAVDEAGNASIPALASYRLLAKDYLPSSSFQPIIKKAVGSNPVAVSAEDYPFVFSDLGYYNGFSLLGIQAQKELDQIYISIRDSPSSNFDDYIKVSLINGKGGMTIPFPSGYKKELFVFAGVLSNGILTVSSSGFSLSASTIGNARGISFESSEPQIIPLSGNALLYWPESNNPIYYSLRGSQFLKYSGPVCISASSETIPLSWYAQDIWGNISSTKKMDLLIKKMRSAPQAFGIENSGVYGLPILVQAAGDGVVRYTLAEGSNPPPVTMASQAVSDGISIPGEKKMLKKYTIRLVSFDADNKPGPDNLISFSIDRVDPIPPKISIARPPAFNAPLSIEFSATAGMKIFYAVSGSSESSESSESSFSEYQIPLEFVPIPGIRQNLTIRAYAENALGLRSEIGVASNIIVDSTSIYLDASLGINGCGSPYDPVATLSDALSLARLNNISRIYLRGAITVEQSLLIDKDMQFVGALDAAWQPSAIEKSSLDFSLLMGTVFPYIMILEAHVSFSGLDFFSDNAVGKKIFDLTDSSLTIENCEIAIAGGSDVNFVSQRKSSLSIKNTSMDFSGIIALRGILSVDSDSALYYCKIYTDSTIRLFEFFNGNGGNLLIHDSALQASPQLMFSGFVLENIEFTMQRSYFKILFGSATCRFLQANNSGITINSFFSEIDWNGNIENFSLQNNSRLSIYHSTLINSSHGLSFINASNSSFAVANCIINADARQASLVNANKIDESSFVLSNCIDGFSNLVEGFFAVQSLDSLNSVFFKPNTRYFNFPVKNFQENPDKTFMPSAKGFRRLSPGSACIDSGLILFPLYRNNDIDNEIVPSIRGKRLPDIGADEL